MGAPWIPPPAIPAKNDGDTLTAKDLKDVVSSLQAFLTGSALIGPSSSANGELPIFSGTGGTLLTGGSRVVFADPAAVGSTTAGIQEAIEYFAGGVGIVMLRAGTLYTVSTTVWTHSGITIVFNGATVKRAVGSVVDGQALNSGAVINVSPFGSNGTVPTSATFQTDIALIGPGTIDGNWTGVGVGFDTVTDVNLGMFGAGFRYIDGLRIEGLDFQNCLQDGLNLVENRNVFLDNLGFYTVGQWNVVSTRNGISLNNHAAAAGWAVGLEATNIRMVNVGDEAIGGSMQWNDVTIDGLTVDGCDQILEMGHNIVTPADISNWTVTNVTGRNTRNAAIGFVGVSTGMTYRNMTFDNIVMEGHASNHESFALTFSTNCNFQRVKFSRLICTNLNSANVANSRWINWQTDSSHSAVDCSISDSHFQGVSGSTDTDDIGALFRGNFSRLRLNHVTFQDVPGVGVAFDDIVATVSIADVTCDHVVVDGANHDGFQLVVDQGSTTISEVEFNHCRAKNCAKQTGASGWRVACANTGSITKIRWKDCRSYKTSGATHLYGIRFFQSAGTLDDFTIVGCDFRGVQTDGLNIQAGTVTGFRFKPIHGRGTDITAAATIAIPQDGDVFVLTGNTNITNGITVNPWDRGRRIKIVATGTPTITATGTSKMAGNYGPLTADDSLCLSCDGTNWNEDGRSVNA